MQIPRQNWLPKIHPLSMTGVTMALLALVYPASANAGVSTPIFPGDVDVNCNTASCCPAGLTVMSGTAAGDLIFPNQANVCVLGKAAGDLIVPQGGAASRLLLFGGSGGDQLHAPPKAAQMLGQEGGDNLYGSPESDLMDGGPGSDQIFGRAGNDICAGGDGNDKMFGGPGEDVLFGDDGDDEIHGDQDNLGNVASNDEVHAGDGNDTVYGDGGDDLLYGGNGNDIIRGGDGADEIFGGPGDDELLGESGNDSITGNEGADIISGADGDDVLKGGADADILTGGAGADQIDGGSGDDVLSGGDGDDQLTPGSGVDAVDGGAGDDAIYILDLCELESGSEIHGGPGNDTVYAPAHSVAELEALGVTVTGVENVVNVPPSCDAECRPACTDPTPEDWRAMCNSFCDRLDVCASELAVEVGGTSTQILTPAQCKVELQCDTLNVSIPGGCDAKTRYEAQRACFFGSCEDIFLGCNDTAC